MAVLKLDIIVNDANAEAKLHQIESAVKGIEGASVRSGAAVTTAAQTHSSAISTMTSAASGWLKMASAMYGGMLIDRGISSLINLSNEIRRNAGTLTDLSAKTGLTISTLQRLDFIGGQAGVTLEMFGNAAYQLGVRLQGSNGKDSVAKAVNDLHLNLQALQSMNSDDQLRTIMSALAGIGNEQERNRVGADLFGRQFKSIAASVSSDWDKMWNAAKTSGDQQIQAIDRLDDAIDRFIKNQKARVAGFIGSLALSGESNGVFGVASNLGYRIAQSTLNSVGLKSAGLDQAIRMAEGRRGTGRNTEPEWNTPAGAEPPKPPEDPAAEARRAAERERRINELKREAEAWQKVNDQITGRSSIKEAQDWMKHLQQVGGLTQITEKATRDLSNTLGDAIEAYGRLGQVAPDAMMRTWIATISPKATPMTTVPGASAPLPNISDTWGNPADLLPGAQSGVPNGLPGFVQGLPGGIPQGPSFLSSMFGSSSQFGSQLASSIMGAIQGGGNVLDSAGSFIGSKLGAGLAGHLSKNLGGLLGGAFNAILPGIGSLLGPLLGAIGSKVMGFFKNLFGGNQVKDLINKSFGSYDALFQQLNPLGEQGQQMWVQLTQRTGKGDVNSAKQQIEAINAALDAHKQKLAETKTAAEQAGAAESAAFQQAKEQVSQLDQQIKSLQQSVASEAPEQVMGIVEAQTRAQIAILQEQRAQAQQQVDEEGRRYLESVDGADVTVNVHWNADPLPGGGGFTPSEETYEPYEAPEPPPMARGGIIKARPGGTIVRVGEAGRDEAIIPLGAGSGGGTAIIQIDGRTMAEIAVPYIPGVVKRYRVGTL